MTLEFPAALWKDNYKARHPSRHRHFDASSTAAGLRSRCAPAKLFIYKVYSVRVWHLECLYDFVAVEQ
jgi:hypothetical protein